ncbi:MAG: SIS domain-containing protein [Kiritimatiellales bacterium]|nr:SIS domain-containing protein [Kiritimatiellales bacterium]
MDWIRIQEANRAVSDQVFNELKPLVEILARELAARLNGGNKIMACGNGGSAADASHFVGELVNRFLVDRKPYAGLALNCDPSVMTCISNDFSFDEIFEKQVQGLGLAGDVLVGFSTSGNSENIVRAFRAAQEMGILTVAFTGGSGGKMLAMADRALVVSCTAHTPRIQEGHELLMHLLCERLEELMENKN